MKSIYLLQTSASAPSSKRASSMFVNVTVRWNVAVAKARLRKENIAHTARDAAAHTTVDPLVMTGRLWDDK